MRKRMKFAKYGMMKYIGHLDLLRVFQRAFKKASVPLAYSQGFNPHPLVSFAQPLGLGFTSTGEYFEMTVTEDMNNQVIIDKVNEAMPEGIKILDCIDLEEDAAKAMALVEVAEYEILLDRPLTQEQLKDFMDQDEILIKKMTKKKKIKEVDLKPGIIDIKLDKEKMLRIICQAGSSNIKPQLIISALYDFLNIDFYEHDIKYHRIDLYTKTERGIIPLT